MYNSSYVVDNAKFRAAQNKYMATSSSIFDHTGTRENLRQERSRQTLEDLKRQVAEREAAKRKEREEDERIWAAMGIPTSYSPSFQESNNGSKREPERRKSFGGTDYASRAPIVIKESAATVSDAGAGYGGSYGANSYGANSYGASSYGASSYDTSGYGGGGVGGGGYGTRSYGGFGGYEPSFGGGVQAARAPRLHANMTSEEREAHFQGRAQRLQEEVQWQAQMKRQLDEEKRKKEELEERLLEENIKRQQEKMKAEYEAEQEKRRKKEEEQRRRREAQLKHMERLQQEAAKEKESFNARTRAAADEASSSLPSSSRYDDRKRTLQRSSSQPEARRRNLKEDDDFGLNLKSDSRFLAAKAPNKFFDDPTTPVKMARTSDDRKRPKPLTPAVGYPQKNMTRRSTPREDDFRTEVPPGETKRGPRHTDFSGGEGEPPGSQTRSNTASAEAQTLRPEFTDCEIQTTPALDKWESERKHEEPRPAVVKGPKFDWKIHIQDMTEEEKEQMIKESEEENKQFMEENQDLMSQLNAMKINLRPAKVGSGFVLSGVSREKGIFVVIVSAGPERKGADGEARRSGGKDSDSGFGDGAKNSPDNGRAGTDSRRGGGRGSDSNTIPAGSSDNVDYMRIVSGRQNDGGRRKKETSYLNLDDSSGTTIRKFLEHTRAKQPAE